MKCVTKEIMCGEMGCLNVGHVKVGLHLQWNNIWVEIWMIKASLQSESWERSTGS